MNGIDAEACSRCDPVKEGQYCDDCGIARAENGLTPAQALQHAWQCQLERDQVKATAKSNRASALGHPCVRYLTLLRVTQPEHMPVIPTDNLGVMREGNLHERDVKAKLLEAGYEVEESQREFTWKEYDISGHVDGFVRVDSTRCPFECKSCSRFLWDQVSDYASLKAEHTSRWLKRYPTQIQLYMLLSNYEQGVFCFKNRDTGKPHFMDVPQDLEVAESALQKAETVNAHMKAGTLPDYHHDPDECFNCDLSLVCNPPCIQQAGPGVEIFADDTLEQLLNRKAELEPARKESEAIARTLKKLVEGKRGLAGVWFIDGKWVERKGYEVKPTRYWSASFKHVDEIKVKGGAEIDW